MLDIKNFKLFKPFVFIYSLALLFSCGNREEDNKIRVQNKNAGKIGEKISYEKLKTEIGRTTPSQSVIALENLNNYNNQIDQNINNSDYVKELEGVLRSKRIDIQHKIYEKNFLAKKKLNIAYRKAEKDSMKKGEDNIELKKIKDDAIKLENKVSDETFEFDRGSGKLKKMRKLNTELKSLIQEIDKAINKVVPNQKFQKYQREKEELDKEWDESKIKSLNTLRKFDEKYEELKRKVLSLKAHEYENIFNENKQALLKLNSDLKVKIKEIDKKMESVKHLGKHIHRTKNHPKKLYENYVAEKKMLDKKWDNLKDIESVDTISNINDEYVKLRKDIFEFTAHNAKEIKTLGLNNEIKNLDKEIDKKSDEIFDKVEEINNNPIEHLDIDKSSRELYKEYKNKEEKLDKKWEKENKTKANIKKLEAIKDDYVKLKANIFKLKAHHYSKIQDQKLKENILSLNKLVNRKENDIIENIIELQEEGS